MKGICQVNKNRLTLSLVPLASPSLMFSTSCPFGPRLAEILGILDKQEASQSSSADTYSAQWQLKSEGDSNRHCYQLLDRYYRE